jgi:hypothetical protein
LPTDTPWRDVVVILDEAIALLHAEIELLLSPANTSVISSDSGFLSPTAEIGPSWRVGGSWLLARL